MLLMSNWPDDGAEDSDLEPWKPRVDILREGGDIVVVVELPGAGKEWLDLEIEGHQLLVRGHRPDPYPLARDAICRQLNHGRFATSLDIPAEFDLSRAKAAYQAGFLHVRIPRKWT